MKALALVTLLSATAHAGGFEVLDRGDAVEVIAHDVTATRTGIVPIRTRLEVPLAGHPQLPRLAPGDATVKLVELEDGNLSVKLGFEHPAVIRLAHVAQAIQVGPDVHIILPRAVPAEGAAVVLPAPTIPEDLVSPVTVPAPPVVQAEAIAPAATQKAIATEASPPNELVADAPKPVAAPALAPTPAKAKPAIAEPAPENDAWQRLATYAAIALAGVGCLGWIVKKKRAAQGPASTIDVIAQRSLGGKAKVVWLAAGGREMVVAVTPQSVRMLSSWSKPAAIPAAQTHSDVAPARKGTAAVSGILKLREKTAPIAEPDVDVDTDAAWAKELLSATGARR